MLLLPNRLVARIVASHAIGPGSIPGLGTLLILIISASGLIVKWLRHRILTPGAWVQSPVRPLEFGTSLIKSSMVHIVSVHAFIVQW